MGVRYIDTGNWETTNRKTEKHYTRKNRTAFWRVRVIFNCNAKEARAMMAEAKANPVSFDEFIPHYLEVIRLHNRKWEWLNIEGEWEAVSRGLASIRAMSHFNTDLNPLELRKVLDYAKLHPVID
jgi:hypothetical protein